MTLHWDCPGCGGRFSVDERLAGRVARCKRCGSAITIPESGDPRAHLHRDPQRVPHQKRAGETAGIALTPLGNRRPDSWIDAVNSHVGLVPLTEHDLPPVRPVLASALADEPPSGPYRVASALSLPALDATTGRPAGAFTVWYRHHVGNLAKLLRWINQTAYLISVPFIMIFLFGVISTSHAFTALGASAVVLLNISRLFSGIMNLLVIPFRDSPAQGLLFLFPPFTLVYLVKNWHKVRNPLFRVLGPLATVGIVILTFAFIPWLRGTDDPGSIPLEIRDGVSAVETVIREELQTAPSTPTKQNRSRDLSPTVTNGLDPG